MSLWMMVGAASAWAQSGEIGRFAAAVEVGSLTSRDASYDLFSQRDAIVSPGLRVGVRVLPWLEVTGSWHRSVRGLSVEVPEADDGLDDFMGGNSSLATALVTDQFAVGPRVDLLVRDVFMPYATAQVTAIRAGARLDDDPSVRTNPNQLRYSGLGAGVQVLGGAEVLVPTAAPLHVSIHADLGVSTPVVVRIGELGRLRPGGLVGHAGVGVRF